MSAPVAVPPPTGAPSGQNVTYYVYQMQAPAAGAGGEAIKVDWSTCFTFYFLRAALNFFNLAAWVILIAGAAQNQLTCNSGQFPTPFPGLTSAQTSGAINVGSAKDCVYFFALLWWAVWLQFTTVVVAIITTFQVFSKYQYVKSIFTTTMYFFIMSSVLLFFIADTYSNATYIAVNKAPVSNDWTAGVTLVTVGAICSLVFNFFWIMWNSYADVPVFPGAPAPAAFDGDAYVAPAGDKPTVTVSA